MIGGNITTQSHYYKSAGPDDSPAKTGAATGNNFMAGNSPTARPIFSQGQGRSRDPNKYSGLENFVGAGGAPNAKVENAKSSTRGGISDNLFNQSIVE